MSIAIQFHYGMQYFSVPTLGNFLNTFLISRSLYITLPQTQVQHVLHPHYFKGTRHSVWSAWQIRISRTMLWQTSQRTLGWNHPMTVSPLKTITHHHKTKVSITMQWQWKCWPEVSAECPWSRPNMLPHALLMAAILAMMGRLWMTKPTSFFWILARLLAWPSSPKPVTSVAPCALYLCIRRAAEMSHWTHLDF